MSYISGTKVISGLNVEELLGTVNGRATYQAYIDTSNLSAVDGDILLVTGRMQVLEGGAFRSFAIGRVTGDTASKCQFLVPVLVEKDMQMQVVIEQTQGIPKSFDWRISNVSSPV